MYAAGILLQRQHKLGQLRSSLRQLRTEWIGCLQWRSQRRGRTGYAEW